MKSSQLLASLVLLTSVAQVSEAGLFDRVLCRKDSKRCDIGCDGCCPTVAPQCCKPVIVRPCGVTVHSYQRGCPTCKPACCDSICGPAGCSPCCPADNACAANGCGIDGCSTGNACCPLGNGDACCDVDCCDGAGCDACCPSTCNDLQELICKSQNACYARQRKAAVQKLSRKYSCACYPQVMCALIFALNDADERVRTAAADAIGDQLRKNPCCCSQQVVAALTCALADCHWHVRWNAKRALKRCGYQIVDGCCEVSCCETGCCEIGCCDASACVGGCTGHGTTGHAAPAVPADLPQGEAAPEAAPAPQQEQAAPEPPSAYFQRNTVRQMSYEVPSRPARKSLRSLFGLAD